MLSDGFVADLNWRQRKERSEFTFKTRRIAYRLQKF